MREAATTSTVVVARSSATDGGRADEVAAEGGTSGTVRATRLDLAGNQRLTGFRNLAHASKR